ncbi:hypothetical protein OJF2_70520 [Aquisphaera giovannonii]|uniref:Uncharacterized protein n=1 Tax=Aquisphaera giovannonii TaxID=406548 RepID=A0A5B9WE02_9BACT|nr:hypothetical protein [Aquisphaera giovannonii]QEH38449.1 hypothetical protein OJF2_70520 [Aquisphaera giovannonii]
MEASRAQSLLGGSGLGGFVERIVSIDEVRAWKPRPEVYRHAADLAGLAPSCLALIAAHARDCHGASRARLATGWVSRPELRLNPALSQPDVRGVALSRVDEALIRLPRD